jgi:2-iminobutanoate/2-iminopropanoate deaminase
MLSTTRRNFAARIASGFAGMGLAGLFDGSAQAANIAGTTAGTTAAITEDQSGVRKLGYDGKATDGSGFITPLIVHNGVIYIAGQGAHSLNPKEEFPADAETHTTKVLENVKTLVEAGGGTMDSILQLTVFLTKIEDFEAMNKVFKTYFPHGGPARTTVAVAALPGQSLVEINCTAAVVRK